MGGAKIARTAKQFEGKHFMTALVTGAAGFLGRYIVQQLLARGEQVTAFCRTVPANSDTLFGPSSANLKIVAGDIRDAVAVESAARGADTVFHTAAIAGVWGPWRRYRQNNVVGTQHVIAACRRHGVRRLIYTSSPSVVFTTTDQSGVDESIPYTTRWLCHYPRSKALAEQAVLAANGANGLHTCSLRPHLLWGPGDRQLLPRLLDRAEWPNSTHWLRQKLGRHCLCRERCRRAFAGCRCTWRRIAGLRPGVLHQSGRAGGLLAMGRRFIGFGGFAAGRFVHVVFCRVAQRDRFGNNVSPVANS